MGYHIGKTQFGCRKGVETRDAIGALGILSERQVRLGAEWSGTYQKWFLSKVIIIIIIINVMYFAQTYYSETSLL